MTKKEKEIIRLNELNWKAHVDRLKSKFKKELQKLPSSELEKVQTEANNYGVNITWYVWKGVHVSFYGDSEIRETACAKCEAPLENFRDLFFHFLDGDCIDGIAYGDEIALDLESNQKYIRLEIENHEAAIEALRKDISASQDSIENKKRAILSNETDIKDSKKELLTNWKEDVYIPCDE